MLSHILGVLAWVAGAVVICFLAWALGALLRGGK